MRDFEDQLTKSHDEKLVTVGTVTAQQSDRVDERIKVVEREVAFVKAGVTGDLAAPLQAQPGYPDAEGDPRDGRHP